MKSCLPFLSLLLTAAAHAATGLTIYNDNLGVIRETIPLDLKAGETAVTFDHATAQVMPDSVVLRDPAGKSAFSILEQGYRNDPVSQALLMSHFEGQSIDFRVDYPDGKSEVKKGKIIRSGYVPTVASSFVGFARGGFRSNADFISPVDGSPVSWSPPASSGDQGQDPIIEMDGKLRFELPGKPMFPELGNDSILRPTLSWTVGSENPQKFDAQLSYLSHGFTWQATYNIVAPEDSDTVSLSGWVTVENHSGTSFHDAEVKLVAGEVNVIPDAATIVTAGLRSGSGAITRNAEPTVTEKSFDDFHLYTLGRPLTLRDQESKQVEFHRAPQIKANKRYIYDPKEDEEAGDEPSVDPEDASEEASKKVAVYWEFRNDESNGLGIPLPAGKVRFYRADDATGSLEFVGEDSIKHTPKDETLKLHTGSAFDLVGERKVTNFATSERQKTLDETIAITVKNHSKTPKEIIVREHLWRWKNWQILKNSDPFNKIDAGRIEFTVSLAPDQEKTVSYTAHYHF